MRYCRISVQFKVHTGVYARLFAVLNAQGVDIPLDDLRTCLRRSSGHTFSLIEERWFFFAFDLRVYTYDLGCSLWDLMCTFSCQYTLKFIHLYLWVSFSVGCVQRCMRLERRNKVLYVTGCSRGVKQNKRYTVQQMFVESRSGMPSSRVCPGGRFRRTESSSFIRGRRSSARSSLTTKKGKNPELLAAVIWKRTPSSCNSSFQWPPRLAPCYS